MSRTCPAMQEKKNSSSPLMRPFAILGGLLTIRIHAMHLNSFLQAFNRLGLTQWEGIEQDIAWGHGSQV